MVIAIVNDIMDVYSYAYISPTDHYDHCHRNFCPTKKCLSTKNFLLINTVWRKTLTVEKSDKNWRIKHFRKFDEQNFDEFSWVFIRASKNKLLWNYHVDSLGREGREMASVTSISALFLPISYLCAIAI